MIATSVMRGHVAEHERAPAQQRGGHQLEHRVLGAADRDGALEGAGRPDEDLRRHAAQYAPGPTSRAAWASRAGRTGAGGATADALQYHDGPDAARRSNGCASRAPTSSPSGEGAEPDTFELAEGPVPPLPPHAGRSSPSPRLTTAPRLPARSRSRSTTPSRCRSGGSSSHAGAARAAAHRAVDEVAVVGAAGATRRPRRERARAPVLLVDHLRLPRHGHHADDHVRGRRVRPRQVGAERHVVGGAHRHRRLAVHDVARRSARSPQARGDRRRHRVRVHRAGRVLAQHVGARRHADDRARHDDRRRRCSSS